jgi:hypothetical protein
MVHRIRHVDDKLQTIIQTFGRKEYKKSEAFITGSVLDPGPHTFWSAGSSRQIKEIPLSVTVIISHYLSYRTSCNIFFLSLFDHI